jgi:hypothetical protein
MHRSSRLHVDTGSSLFFWLLIGTFAIVSIALQWGCAKERTAPEPVEPVKLLFTGDVGGALDPCG